MHHGASAKCHSIASKNIVNYTIIYASKLKQMLRTSMNT